MSLQITDLALDVSTGDLLLPPQWISGGPVVLQRFIVRAKWFRGEWLLDQNQGTPWYEQVLVKNPNPVVIGQIFKRVLLSTPGVLAVLSFAAQYSATTRSLTLSFSAQLTDDTTLTASDLAFII